MEQQKITVRLLNTDSEYQFEAGTSLAEVYKGLKLNLPYKVVSAKVNNKTEPLSYRLYAPKTIRFVDISDPSGMRVYVRSLCFVLAKAVADTLPDAQITIEHPIAKGYFCRLSGHTRMTDTLVENIKQRMHELIAADHPFVEVETFTEEVVSEFRKHGFEDKALLLEGRKELYAKYYRMDGFSDFFYGALVPSSGHLTLFDLQKFEDGLLLRIPNRNQPTQLEDLVLQPKMFAAYGEQLKLLSIIGMSNVGELNRAIEANRITELINVAEAYQEKKIANIAQDIAQEFNNGIRIVLIAGPSSSGKTTFRKRLEIQLLVNGLKPVGISLDDYFVNRTETPRDENGDYDFEALNAINLEQLGGDLDRLLQGDIISMPTYNFLTGKQEFNGNFLKLEPHNVLILEGIHGLNPELTRQIPNEKKYPIYVSALTAISLDNHNWISTADNRMIRRIVRDFNYRGRSATETIALWQSVRNGEEKWIYPFQENARMMFNSAMLYEFAALRRHAEPILWQVPKNAPEYAEAYRLLRFLSYFEYIADKDLPPTSLLREFLGGSTFEY